MYRKFKNSVILKSGVNFKTFSEIFLSFRENKKPRVRLFTKANRKRANSLYIRHKKKLADEIDSETDSENFNKMDNYKTPGDRTRSYKSDFFFIDSKFDINMTYFSGQLQNNVDNQFMDSIQLNVHRRDIDYKNSNPNNLLFKSPSYLRLKKHAKEVQAKINEIGKEPLFFIMEDVDLTTVSVRTKENNFANWISRLMQIEIGADVLICHGGCLRSMRSYENGHLFTVMDLLKLSPVPDHYEYMLLTGQLFVQVLENGYRGLPNPLGSFPQLSGARVHIDISENYSEEEVMKRPSNKLFSKRVKNVQLDFAKFDPEMTMVVAGHHFIIEGKDGFVAFKKAKRLGMGHKCITNIQEIQDFGRLLLNKNYKEEYQLFKIYISPYIRDSHMKNVQKKNDFLIIDHKEKKLSKNMNRKNGELKKLDFLDELILKKYNLIDEFNLDRFVEMLNSLKISALKRLRKYRLVEGIRKYKGRWVFEIKPKFFSRIKWS